MAPRKTGMEMMARYIIPVETFGVFERPFVIRPLLSGHCPVQLGTAPQFSAHICCSQIAGWIKMPLGTEVGLNPSDIVLEGDPAPLPKRGHNPQFSVHVYCGQTAGWIKIAQATLC